MGAQSKNHNLEWRHPIPVSLLKLHHYERELTDIIEEASVSLLAQLRTQEPSCFSDNVITPIEAVAEALNIKTTYICSSLQSSAFAGSAKRSGAKFEVSQTKGKQSYFRQRFTLAHEIGHIVLRRLAGPLSYEELAQTEDTGREEEAICDLFASALLLPKSKIEAYFDHSDVISPIAVDTIAKDFKVSRSVVLRRIAQLTESILILWNEAENPLRKDSENTQRITQVYPRISQLTQYFIPLYCTPSDLRFSPNLVFESLSKGISTCGSVEIKDVGSLPHKLYWVHNIFFQRWADNAISPDLLKAPQRFFSMATLISLKDNLMEEQPEVSQQLRLFE